MTRLDWMHVEAFQRTRGDRGFDPAVRLSWMRTKCPDAFKHLCQTDTECASIAVQRKWVFEADLDPQLGWGNRQAVARTIAKAQARLSDGRPNAFSVANTGAIRGALERYAPENLDLQEPV